MSKPSSIDLGKLLTASDDALSGDHIWAVKWEAKVPTSSISVEDLKCSECNGIHDIEAARLVGSTTTILGGPDGQPCLDRMKTHILKSNPEFSGYCLRGLKLLAVAEVK